MTDFDGVFNSFDPAAELEIGERNLPHWFQPGAATFITFRTADSLPSEVMVRWQLELREWLEARKLPPEFAALMSRERRLHQKLLQSLDSSQQIEFRRLSDRIYHRSLDEAHGACLLRQPICATIVAEAIRFHDGAKYDLDRFVVMPNHVHAIVQFRAGESLRIVSESWMRYSARRINALTGSKGAFWQPEAFDHIIRNADQFAYLQRYVRENPTRAHLRENEFLYWARSR